MDFDESLTISSFSVLCVCYFEYAKKAIVSSIGVIFYQQTVENIILFMMFGRKKKLDFNRDRRIS